MAGYMLGFEAGGRFHPTLFKLPKPPEALAVESRFPIGEQPGYVRYVPERTCRNEAGGLAFSCSLCDAEFDGGDETGIHMAFFGEPFNEDGNYDREPDFNYCPNCGAKVVG